MAYYDLEEQEQLSTLQAWWKQWGAIVLTALALGLAAVAGTQGWAWYQREQAGKAAAAYEAVTKAVQEGDSKRALASAATLLESYPKSGYAPLAALLSARLSFEGGDLAMAKERLQWVVDRARDDDFKSVARLRLAGVLFDEKAYDAALKLLDLKPEEPMANLYADLRGDVLTAKGALAEARAAYQTALEKTDSKSPYRNLIQIKIDALGQAK